MKVSDFVTGAGRKDLGEGELLRSVTLPARALASRTAFRQASLYGLGRSGVLVIGVLDPVDGPLGAKSMSESPFNPVAPAFANALRDATGIRFTELPLTRDRVWLALHEAGRSRQR